MLVQWFRRDVRGRDASIRRAALLHPSFGIAVLKVHGLAQDWGAQLEVVSFMSRMRRTQLSILLEGRGYFALPQGPLMLRPGDVIESDQRLGEAEGYSGTPALVLFVEWDEDTLFGPSRRGAAQHSRLSREDVGKLRDIVSRLARTPPEVWVVELCARLRACGLGVAREIEPPAIVAPRVAPVFEAMGEALTRLDDFPSLGEVARSLNVGERQARRRFQELVRDFAQPYDGWRDFLSDARLGWVTQLLSVPGLTLSRVAELSGFRSPVALAHAFSLRGARPPGQMARELAARWH